MNNEQFHFNTWKEVFTTVVGSVSLDIDSFDTDSFEGVFIKIPRIEVKLFVEYRKNKHPEPASYSTTPKSALKYVFFFRYSPDWGYLDSRLKFKIVDLAAFSLLIV